MRRYIQRNVEDAIANIIVSDHNQNISVILIDSDGTELKFDYR